MDTELKEIIQKIRSEGLERAQEEAKDILADAKSQSEEILRKAGQEADKILRDAEREREHLLDSAKSTLRHAARDLCIRIEQEIQSYFTRLLQPITEGALEHDSAILNEIVHSWSQGKAVLEVSEPLLQATGESVRKQLLEEARKKGLEIQPVKTMKGFKVLFDQEASYVDLTPEAISAMLSAKLQPWLAALIKETS